MLFRSIDISIRIFKTLYPPKSIFICDIDISRKLIFNIFDINKWIFSFHKYSLSNKLFKKKLNHLRNNLKVESLNNDFSELEFEDKIILIVETLLSKYIPTSIYHGCQLSIERCKNIFPLISPKNIITSSNILLDEVFNIFIINNISHNSEYSIIQHGGGYGFSKLNDEEEYQLNTADYFF